MYAILTEVDTSGQPDPALGLKALQEQIVPAARQTPGFRAGYWLRPLEDAKGTSLALYDTEENAQVAAQGLSVGSSPMPGARVIRSEVRAVAASADEAEAFEVEAAVIDVLKIAGIELANVVSGHGTERGRRPLDEIMAEYAAQPVEVEPEHRVLLIRLNRKQWLAPGDLYEKTRASWKVAPGRHKPAWVFAVYGGIVRAVYRIENWEQPPEEKRIGKGARLNGVRDLAMEDIYLWTDVSGYLRRGAQNPITYIHC